MIDWNSGCAVCLARNATTSSSSLSRCCCRNNGNRAEDVPGNQLQASGTAFTGSTVSGGPRLAQCEREQIAVGGFAPGLVGKPIKERRFSQLRIEAPATPVVTHVRAQSREFIVFE